MKSNYWWKDTVAAGIIMLLVLAAAPFADTRSDTALNPGSVSGQAGIYSFELPSSGNTKKTVTEEVYYSDSFFDKPNSVYDMQLAEASLALAVSGFEEEYARELLDAEGYKEITSYRYDEKSDEDKTAMMLACKDTGGSPVIAVCIRGGNYGDEWGSNGRLSGGELTGYHYGFNAAAEDALKHLAEYAGDQGIPLKDAKVWLTGFSRGAAVANVLGAKLQEYGVVDLENLYCYTFAAPAAVTERYLENSGISGGNVEEMSDSVRSPEGIYNIVNPLDIVTRMPMNAAGKSKTGSGKTAEYSWDYVRYGTTVNLPVSRADMLQVVDLLEHSLAFATRSDQRYAEKYQDDVIIPLLKEHMGDSAGKAEREKIISSLIEALPGVGQFIARKLNALDFRSQLYIGNMISGAEEQRLLKEHWPSTYWKLLNDVP